MHRSNTARFAKIHIFFYYELKIRKLREKKISIYFNFQLTENQYIFFVNLGLMVKRNDESSIKNA